MDGLLQRSNYRVATAHDTVLNSECAFTFHSPFTSDKGILVNLETFMGTIEELAGEGLFLRIVKKRVVKEKVEGSTELEPTKLGVGVEGGFASEDDQFQIVSTYSLVGLVKDGETLKVVEERPYNDDTKASFDNALVRSLESIKNHSGMAVQQDLSVWQLDDEPMPISKYAAELPFVDNGKLISPDPSDWKCEHSGATENLWLNLSDGYIGGGRRNWDGSGGSNGALDHFNETGQQYPLVVKLGTITADIETADCYSYAPDEDGPVKIPNLADMLQKRGINVTAMQKTVKSTAELEVELNATYAFDAITEAGANLVPVSGPTLQGLQNLGNSCYMNSVVQLLLSGTVPELARRYGASPGDDVAHHVLFQECSPRDAPTDLLCQTAKLSLALTTGAFAVPESILNDETQKDVSLDPKYRIQPRMFKHVVASDHVDFRTGQQQDAAQFLLYLLEQLDSAEQRRAHIFGSDEVYPSSHLFSFRTTTRLVCGSDQKIKYKDSDPGTMLSLPVPMEKATLQVEPEQKRHKVSEPSDSKDEDKVVPTVAFSACLDSWAAETTLDDFRWAHIGNSVAATTSQNRLSNFPRYLLVHIMRYTLGADWTPHKLEVNLDIPQDLDLTAFRSEPPREGEDIVVDDDVPKSAAPKAPAIDENALAQLMDMGFTFNGCKRALTAVGGSDVEAAMTWVFEHNMDPDFNDPLPEGGETEPATVDSDGIDDGLVMSLVESLGCFSVEHVRAALKHSGGASDQAADWLFSNMDDLDRAVAALSVKPSKAELMSSAARPALPLDDGEGKYTMVGMVSHIGKHTGSGHYVAHLKRDDKWVIFNDEKVAISATPPFAHAYIYLYQRNDTIGSPDPHY